MTHVHELQDQDVEELAEELLTLLESGHDRLADVRASTQLPDVDAAVAELVARGLARFREPEQRVELTSEGRALAERQVRRHRLAEVLFSTVLEVRDDEAVNRTACVMEHVLSPALTESVCSFLGHPPRCPHGKPIPPGDCCRTFSTTIEPVVVSLDRLPVGEAGRIVHVVSREKDRLVRLAGLGVSPGARVTLQQKSPATVLRIGETTVALEPTIARQIFVRREDAKAPPPGLIIGR